MEYSVHGNVIQVNFQKAQPQPKVQAVDTDLLNSIEAFLETTARTHKGSNKQSIWFRNEKNIRKYVTVYAYVGRELKKAQRIVNYADRLAAYLKITAVVKVFTAPAGMRFDENHDPITELEQVSEARIADGIAKIRQFGV
jgi:hypothetical protein